MYLNHIERVHVMHVAATKPRAPILLHLRYSLTCEGRGQRALLIVTTALRTHKCISAAEQPEPAGKRCSSLFIMC